MLHQLKRCVRRPYAAILAGSLLAPSLAYADVTYQETTQITGGSMVGMLKMVSMFSSQAKSLNGPMNFKVMIHGGRMVRSGLHLTQIIDLDRQTMTSIDNDKHTYTVMTFQQLQQQMSKAMGQAKGSTTSDSPQMTFDAHVTKNGTSQLIDGKNAAESLLTITMRSKQAEPGVSSMAATSEVWSIDDCPGLKEWRAFNQRMAKEMAVPMQTSGFSSLMASQPGGEQAVAELTKESAKISGFPVLQISRVGMTPDGQPLPAPSVAPLKSSNNKSGSSTASAITKEAATGTATQTANDQASKLGSFGRAVTGSTMGAIMHHKPKTTSSDSTSAAASTPDLTANILMETRTQASGFSVAPVEASALEVPAGYKAVAAPGQGK